MKAIKNLLNHKSIRFKWLISYIAIILSIIFTLTVLNAVLFSRSINDISNSYTIQMIQQVKINIEFYIRDMDNIGGYINQNPFVETYLKGNYSSPEERNVIEENIKELFRMYTTRNPEIAGLLLADNRGNYVSDNMTTVTRDLLNEEEWYQKAIKEPDKIHLISKPIGRNVRSIYEHYRAEDIVSIVKAVQDDNNRFLGVILIDLKLKTIDDIISNIALGKSGFLYVVDRSGDIVYTPVNKIVYRIESEWVSNDDIRTIQTIGSEKYQILYDYSNYMDWYVAGVFSLDETLMIIDKIRYFTAIYSSIVLVAAVLISFLYTNSITKPISKLRRLMRQAEDGELDVRFNHKSDDEIGQLGNSFNKMIEAMKNLINLVYVEQQKKKEAELKAFQAQIKPHFLYNTLDTIHWMAQEYKADDISKIVNALTNFFRISLSKGKEIITVKEELKQVESYLTIQMARYEDKFDYNIKYDSSILQQSVIKLLLQPIVENAIYHGIKEKRGKGYIGIEVNEVNDKICFVVEDNGVGMDEKKVEELNTFLKERRAPDDNYGIGIQNVNERIKLTYGEEYGVIVKSTISKGTRVEIWHPIITR